MLITLEGIDGSGKSTLFYRLQESLADLSPVFTREPGSTWIGECVRRAISEEADPVAEALLFAADHAAHIEAVIRPALREGKIVISDRYSDSRYAYQAVSLKGRIHDPMGWLKQMHAGWTIPPDRTFLLVLPEKTALSRKKGLTEPEHFEQADILARVQENYLSLAKEEPGRFVVVDAEKGEEEVSRFVEATIRQWDGLSRSRPRG